MQAEIFFSSAPAWLHIFSLLLFLLFFLQRKQLRLWVFFIPLLTSLLLWGPGIRFYSSGKLRLIRVDTSASLRFVSKPLLQKTLTDVLNLTGLSKTDVIDLEGNPFDIDAIPNTYSRRHKPLQSKNELFVADVFSPVTENTVLMPASIDSPVIVSAETPTVCYHGEICQIRADVLAPTGGSVFIEIDGQQKTAEPSPVGKGFLTFSIGVNDLKKGNHRGRLFFKHESPLAQLPFILNIRDALPKGAFVFDAPSLATWQAAKVLANVDTVKIQALRKVDFKTKNDFSFLIWLSRSPPPTIFSKKLLVLSGVHFNPRDLFEPQEQLYSELTRFLSGVSIRDTYLPGMALGYGSRVCYGVGSQDGLNSPNSFIKTEDGQVLGTENRTKNEICSVLGEAESYVYENFHFSSGVSLQERASIAQNHAQPQDMGGVIAKAKEQANEISEASVSLYPSSVNKIEILFFIGYIGLLFFAWYRSPL